MELCVCVCVCLYKDSELPNSWQPFSHIIILFNKLTHIGDFYYLLANVMIIYFSQKTFSLFSTATQFYFEYFISSGNWE